MLLKLTPKSSIFSLEFCSIENVQNEIQSVRSQCYYTHFTRQGLSINDVTTFWTVMDNFTHLHPFQN